MKFCIDTSLKKSLDACGGSLIAGDGFGAGDCSITTGNGVGSGYGVPWGKGYGNGYSYGIVDYGNTWGDSSGRGFPGGNGRSPLT